MWGRFCVAGLAAISSLHAVEWTDVNGVVCVEVESATPNGLWTQVDGSSADQPTNHTSGFIGSYFWFDRSHNTGVINWSNTHAMNYTINITQAGNYTYLAKGLIGYDTQRGEHNDHWVKLSGQPIEGEFTISNNKAVKAYLSEVNKWTYHSATDHSQEVIRQYFSVGQHTVQIAGRSSDYCDRFYVDS